MAEIEDALPLAALCRAVERRRGRRSEAQVVVCFDVEPDARVLDAREPSPWRGFERLAEQVSALRDRLSALTGAPVAFTWTMRMDPQIGDIWGTPDWVARAYGQELARLEAAGDEFGLHTHLWRSDGGPADWIEDLDPAWTRHCVATAVDAFEAAFGRPCAVHRGGRHTLTGAMFECLSERRVSVDLTPEAGLPPTWPQQREERATAPSTDYRAVPIGPYRSSAARVPAPDPAGPSEPLLIPLLGAPTLKAGRRPLVVWTGRNRFAVRALIGAWRSEPPALAFAVRSDAPLNRVWWRNVVCNLEHLAAQPGRRFVTASAALQRLEPGRRQVLA